MVYEFSPVKVLGEGSQGSIWLWRNSRTGELVAAKAALRKEDKASLVHEARMLELLRRWKVPGVVQAWNSYGTLTELSHPCLKAVSGNVKGKHHLLLKYCNGGDLASRLKKQNKGRLSETKAALIIRSLVETLRCCHDHGVMHRDVKLENIFLNSCPSNGKKRKMPCNDDVGKCSSAGAAEEDEDDEEVLLGDFGDSFYFGSYKPYSLSECVGTIRYTAPEFAIYREILTKELYPNSATYAHLSSDARTLLMSMLDKNPESRITLEDIQNHPWLERNTSLTAKSIGPAPRQVISTNIRRLRIKAPNGSYVIRDFSYFLPQVVSLSA